MKAISFFSGVGMFDLGLHAAGFDIIAQVEYEEFCQDVLRARWQFFSDNKPPEIYGDIRAITGDDLPEGADLFIGGFPCQPFSMAGHRQGEDDSRNMWTEFRRIISDYRPRWVVLENVSAITIPNDGRPAYALTVVRELAEIGYSVSWDFITAEECGLPHRRERWWCVAKLGNGKDEQYKKQDVDSKRINQEKGLKANSGRTAATNAQRELGNTISGRKSSQHINAGLHRQQATDDNQQATPRNIRRLQPIARRITQPGMDRKPDGLACWMDRPIKIAGRGQAQYDHEPPRLVPGHPENWSKRIKALGNGGIPHIAYNIGREILARECD